MHIVWNKVTWYSKLLALVIFVLVPVWAFMIGAAYQATLDNTMQITSTARPSVGYAPTSWKTWRDGEYAKNGKTYVGYELRYPRDFDVYQGDQASGGIAGTTRVKISFPQDAFLVPKTNYGEAFSTVSVGADAASVRDCYNNVGPTGTTQKMTDTTTVKNIAFHKGNTVDVGAGNIYTSELYRVLHENRCYEVALTVHTGNIANYTPGSVNEFDKEKAYAMLRQILKTFRFTDKNPFM